MRTARSEIGGAPPCGSFGRDEAKTERSSRGRVRGGARLPFNEAEATGGLPRRATWARLRSGLSGRLPKEGGGADAWGRAVSD